MIAEVKKYTFLVHHSDYSSLLDSLRDLGVVHIVEKRKLDENSTVGDDMKALKKYREAIRKLSALLPDITEEDNPADPSEALDEFRQLLTEIENARYQTEILDQEAEKALPWGDFDKNIINKLKAEGWRVRLFTCPEKKFDRKWEELYHVEIISRNKGRLYFALIHKEGEDPDLKADEVNIPEQTISTINTQKEKVESKIRELESLIEQKAPLWKASLNKGIEETMSRLQYVEAAEQADKYADDNLYVLEGWIPVSEEKGLQKLLEKSDCYSFVSEPEPGEKIPVILQNSKFASLFEPIAKLFALPAYSELDLTPFFAPFFMLFFGFCLGDAGYGLIFILAGFIVKRKVDKKYKPIITLAQYFGVAALFMGLLSGTFFGINLIDSGYTITEHSVRYMNNAGVPDNTVSLLDQTRGVHFDTRKSFSEGISQIIGDDSFNKHKRVILKSADSDIPFLNTFRHLMLDSLNMFYLAMLLGALQIIFGMALKVVNISKQKGFRYSLSTIGWIVLILTLSVFQGGNMLGIVNIENLRLLYLSLIVIAGVLIFLFNNPDKNIFIRLGLGLWDSYGIITGVFGDLLSYIRLFALGISSSILGFVFNEISAQLLSVKYVGWLFFIIVLLIGHSLNIAIAALGSFVHPMRLTFVEFYKNAGFTGGGIEYKPFKIKK